MRRAVTRQGGAERAISNRKTASQERKRNERGKERGREHGRELGRREGGREGERTSEQASKQEKFRVSLKRTTKKEGMARWREKGKNGDR